MYVEILIKIRSSITFPTLGSRVQCFNHKKTAALHKKIRIIKKTEPLISVAFFIDTFFGVFLRFLLYNFKLIKTVVL